MPTCNLHDVRCVKRAKACFATKPEADAGFYIRDDLDAFRVNHPGGVRLYVAYEFKDLCLGPIDDNGRGDQNGHVASLARAQRTDRANMGRSRAGFRK